MTKVTCTFCNILLDASNTSLEEYLVCMNCGTVNDIFIDFSAEWRVFNTDSGRDTTAVRCGNPSLNDEGAVLNTFINGTNRKMHRVQLWSHVSNKNQNMIDIIQDFKELAAKFGLDKDIIDTASSFYSELHLLLQNNHHGIKRYNVRVGLTAACLYFACKKAGFPRERKEIAFMINTPVKVVTKGCNAFLDIMGSTFIKMEPCKAQDFIPRFCSALQIQSSQEKICKVIDSVCDKQELGKFTPTTIACGAIYYTCSSSLSKEKVSEVCGCSVSIIRKVAQVIASLVIE